MVVTDANGCTSTGTVSVTQPAQLTSTISVTGISCFGQTDGSFSMAVSGGVAPYASFWNNGDTVSVTTNLSVGNYPMTITDAAGCSATATVAITQPAVLTNTISVADVSCFGQNDGVVSATVSGGTMPYTYSWDNGQTTSAATNLAAGNYSVAITDNNGCTSTGTAVITQPGALSAGFTASTYTLDIALGSDVTFTNGSSGAVTYQWNFGDGSPLDVSVNPIHSYTATGSYTVTLISSDGPCSDTTTASIVVVNSNPTGLNTGNYSSQVNVIYENGEVYLLFSLSNATRVNISVYNLLGEEIFFEKDLQVKNDKIKLDIPVLSAGVYVAVSEFIDERVSKKFILPVR